MRKQKNHYLCNMKRIPAFLLAAVLLMACQRSPERPLPLQMTYAQHELDQNKDGVFALYLLSELEDSIDQMPDYIQTRYEAMKAEAEKVKNMHPVHSFRNEDVYEVVRQRDSLYQRQLEEERMLYEARMMEYREHLDQSQSRQWWGLAVLVTNITGLVLLLSLRHRKRKQKQEEVRKLMPTSIEQQLATLADMGQQPLAEDWEALHQQVLQAYPQWEAKLHIPDAKLTQRDLQLCLLSTTALRPKQIATLLNVSQQNLRNLRVRLYTKLTGQECVNVNQFTEWMKR